MSQLEALAQILYRTEKSALTLIEKEFAGKVMEPRVVAVYERKKANVADLESKLNKKGTSS